MSLLMNAHPEAGNAVRWIRARADSLGLDSSTIYGLVREFAPGTTSARVYNWFARPSLPAEAVPLLVRALQLTDADQLELYRLVAADRSPEVIEAQA